LDRSGGGRKGVDHYGPSFAASLELGEGDKCLGLLYVGWPKKDLEWPVSKRSDAMAKVTFK
jgi:hypothetical protein